MAEMNAIDKSSLVQVMAWCHQAICHYLSQCLSRSLSPYHVTRPQWVNPSHWKNMDIGSNLVAFSTWHDNRQLIIKFPKILKVQDQCLEFQSEIWKPNVKEPWEIQHPILLIKGFARFCNKMSYWISKRAIWQNMYVCGKWVQKAKHELFNLHWQMYSRTPWQSRSESFSGNLRQAVFSNSSHGMKIKSQYQFQICFWKLIKMCKPQGKIILT